VGAKGGGKGQREKTHGKSSISMTECRATNSNGEVADQKVLRNLLQRGGEVRGNRVGSLVFSTYRTRKRVQQILGKVKKGRVRN